MFSMKTSIYGPYGPDIVSASRSPPGQVQLKSLGIAQAMSLVVSRSSLRPPPSQVNVNRLSQDGKPVALSDIYKRQQCLPESKVSSRMDLRERPICSSKGIEMRDFNGLELFSFISDMLIEICISLLSRDDCGLH